MFKFFDYVFYLVCKSYSKTDDSNPEGAALAVVAGMQTFNTATLIMLLELIKETKSILNKPIAIVIISFFLITNYIRYIYMENNNYKVLKEKVTTQSNFTNKNKDKWAILYIVASTIVFFSLAIYLGSKKW